MTTTGFAIAFAIIATLFLISHLRFRKQGDSTESVSTTEVNLPSGVTLTNEEILSLNVEYLSSCSVRDLQVLVDYAGHRMYDAGQAQDTELHDKWGQFFELASAALYGYL